MVLVILFSGWRRGGTGPICGGGDETCRKSETINSLAVLYSSIVWLELLILPI